MTIKTSVLKQLLSKAMRAVKNDKLLPLTGLLGINTFEDGFIQLTTYDGNNLLLVSKEVGCEENSYFVVEATSFSSLINRLTSDEVTLLNKETHLEVKSGKGVYKFDLAFEDTGKMVEFPQNEMSLDNTHNIKLNELMYALNINEASVSKTFEQANLTGAYFGNMLITTNGYLACLTNVNLQDVFGSPLLFNYNTLKLLPVFDGNEQICVAVDDNRVCLYDSESIIIGNLMPEVKSYPADALLKYLLEDYTFNIQVSKAEFLDSLNRLNIFVKPYDKNLIKLIIKGDTLTLKSLTNSAEDSIQLSGGDANFSCNIDYNYLKLQVASCYNEKISLGVKSGVAIMLFDGIATHIISIGVEE